MKWSGIYGGIINYGTRKYKLERFEVSAWAVFRGKEYFVRGFTYCKRYGNLALLGHPTDDRSGKIVLRSELTVL